tara:strand:- start:26701 stop:27840 length:1140 start_codon:yes stop_codon:yes gene_type:complete
MKRRIAVFSGKRGGFGALINLMKLINNDKSTNLHLIVTDMHLSKKFGYTINEVKKSFNVNSKIKLNQKNDTGISRVIALGDCQIKVSKILKKTNPDILILLGDRGEVLSAAIAATELNIPIAHILGGDLAGNRDGNRIHAISKLSHLHFPSSADSYNRLIKLGEEPWRVNNFGATYVDNIIKKNFTKNINVRKKYHLKINEKYIICIQHPTTLNEKKAYSESINLFKVLSRTDYKILLIYPCSDQGYLGVLKAINIYKKNKNFNIYKNIEAYDFWGLMEGASLFIGNSSSGLIETPYFGLPTVNLGNRQNGRIRDINVIDSSYKIEEIEKCIKRGLSKQFKSRIKNNFIFGKGDASKKIFNKIKNIKINQKLIMKKMTY